MHEENADHFLSDCDVLAQVGITGFGFMSKDSGILNEDMTGCILEKSCITLLMYDHLFAFISVLKALQEGVY